MQPDNITQEEEHLIDIVTEDSSVISIYRHADKSVRACHKDSCITIPKATGRQALDIFSILQSASNGELLHKDINSEELNEQ